MAETITSNATPVTILFQQMSGRAHRLAADVAPLFNRGPAPTVRKVPEPGAEPKPRYRGERLQPREGPKVGKGPFFKFRR